MTDKNRKGYAEPSNQDLEWVRTSHNTNESHQDGNSATADTNGDSSEIEDVQEDGTVAVGSGLGIDE